MSHVVLLVSIPVSFHQSMKFFDTEKSIKFLLKLDMYIKISFITAYYRHLKLKYLQFYH